MRTGDKLQYKCHFLLYEKNGISQGVETMDAVYLGRAGQGKYLDFQNSDYIVEGKHGIVGIGKEQVMKQIPA